MKRNYLLILASVLTPLLVSGQSYYDDDIYYNPSKVKKTEKREVKKQITEGTADFEEPTYQVYTSNPRDVDEYNRRGAYKVSADTISADTVVANPDVFQYTERMERFDNPTIVVSSDDSRLKELYYADNVNIYVGTPSVTWSIGGFYDPWYSPCYRSSWYYNSWDWSFGWGCYRPYYGWYDPFWGPSYPYYGWGYGWSYPHYYPYYPYYPGGHHYYSDGGRRPFSASHSPSGRRPELSRHGNYSGSDSYRSTGRRPSVSTERTTPSYSSPSHSTDRTPSYRQPSTSSPSRGSSYGGFRGGSSSGGRGSFSGGGRGGRR